MKKLFNFRPICLLSLIAVFSSILSIFVTKSIESKAVVVLICAVFAVLLFIFCLAFKKIGKVLQIFVIITILIVFLSAFQTQKNLTNLNRYSGTQVQLSGQVKQNFKWLAENKIMFDLTNIKINGESESGEVTVFLNPKNFDISKIKTGAVANMTCNINVYNLSGDTSKLSYISAGKVASVNVLAYQFEIVDDSNLTLRDKIKNSVFESLGKTEYGEIGYAMLFGDSSELSSVETDTFRATGIAHLLAVSGLHVSIIAMALTFIMSKLKFSRLLQLLILLPILAFYCYLCNFSISVIRASLMAIFASYALIRGKPYDNLTVLSLIALIVLLINPLQLYNLSFILSFTAILSIIFLIEPLTRFFDKIFYKKLSSLLALNVSIQIGLFAVQVYFFGRFPLCGILANLISVPIATFSFIFLFFLAFLSPIFSTTHLINLTFGLPMSLIMKINYWISSVAPVFSATNISVLVLPLSILLMFILSDFVFLKRKTKTIICSGIVAFLLVFLCIAF